MLPMFSFRLLYQPKCAQRTNRWSIRVARLCILQFISSELSYRLKSGAGAQNQIIKHPKGPMKYLLIFWRWRRLLFANAIYCLRELGIQDLLYNKCVDGVANICVLYVGIDVGWPENQMLIQTKLKQVSVSLSSSLASLSFLLIYIYCIKLILFYQAFLAIPRPVTALKFCPRDLYWI